MRRTLLPPALAIFLVLGLVPGAGALSVPQPVLPGLSITTDNVAHVGYIADLGPTVSARVVEVDGRRRLYASSVGRGLTIYDISEPEAPELLGALPIPTWQNEDMAVSDDGRIVILAQGDANVYTANLVVDASDPSLPELVGITDGGDHTGGCANPECSYVYGSEGNIYDLSDPAEPVTLDTTWIQHAKDQGVNVTGFPHKVVLDDAGYLITDSDPRVMFDVTDPENPVVVTSSLPSTHRDLRNDNIRYQHNNLRPRAEDWEPRTDENADEPGLLPGELLLASGETNVEPQCDGTNGPFMTWSARDFDDGRTMTLLETFRPLENGTYTDGNPAVNAVGCSSHWFDWASHDAGDTYTVAAAWFEHGVRFLEVDAATGGISEVGFYQPVSGSAGAAYWVDDEYLYVTDYVRGIDILKFDPDPDLRPTQAELDANWVAGLDLPRLPQTEAYLAVCKLATR